MYQYLHYKLDLIAWQTSCIIETENPTLINQYGQNFTNTFMKTYINGGQYAINHGRFLLDSCHQSLW